MKYTLAVIALLGLTEIQAIQVNKHHGHHHMKRHERTNVQMIDDGEKAANATAPAVEEKAAAPAVKLTEEQKKAKALAEAQDK